MPRLVRITTVPVSLQVLLKGQMRFMKEHGFDVTMISADGPEVNTLMMQEQSPHRVVPFTRTISPFRDLKSLYLLTLILRKAKPDIVHTHTPKAGLIGMWASLLAGVPIRLHTIAGLPWMETRGPVRWLLKQMERLTALAATRVYPNSHMLKKFLESESVAAGKMKVLGKGSSNGINCQHYTADDTILKRAAELRSKEGIPPDGWIWIFVGRIVRDKGIGELIDAFTSVHQRYPSDRLWLLGEEEPELDPLEERHRRVLHKHEAIRCWGFQKDIRPYLAASRVLVFPSYREGFPNVPMQAGSMGCTLILSDINGCNEIVDHGVNGLLVKPKDSGDLLQAMMRVREDDAMSRTMAGKIAEKIRRDYDQRAVWNAILDEYRYWLNEKKIADRGNPV